MLSQNQNLLKILKVAVTFTSWLSNQLKTSKNMSRIMSAPSPPIPGPPPPPPPKTIGEQTPQFKPRIRHDPYSMIHTTVKAAPPLPQHIATRLAPGKWGDPQLIMQSFGSTITELENRIHQPTSTPQGSHPHTTQQQPPPTATQDSRTQHATRASTPADATRPHNTSALDTLRTKLQRQPPANTQQTQAPQKPAPSKKPPVELLPRRDHNTVKLVYTQHSIHHNTGQAKNNANIRHTTYNGVATNSTRHISTVSTFNKVTSRINRQNV